MGLHPHHPDGSERWPVPTTTPPKRSWGASALLQPSKPPWRHWQTPAQSHPRPCHHDTVDANIRRLTARSSHQRHHGVTGAPTLGHRLPHHQSTTAQQANIQTSRRRPRHHEAASTPPPQTKPPPRSRRCETPSPPWGTPAAQQAAAPQHAGHPRRRRQTRTTAARSAKPVCNEHVCMYV